MPLETFSGRDIPALLTHAQAVLGVDAVVLSVRRSSGGGFELVAADPESAGAAERAAPRKLIRAGQCGMIPRLDAGPSGNGPAFIALVGPTGAGKTTTIAKLATHPHVFGGRRVGLLCLDTYRIGGVEQSRIYAEIAKIPIEVAYEAGDLAAATRRLRDREVVLVDTAGRGPAVRADVKATFDQLRRLRPLEVHLVVPAGLRPQLARRVVAEYRPRGVTHLLASKMDEFPGDAMVFDLAADFGLPMRWLTDGQEVPTDLKSAAARLRNACERPAADRTAPVVA
ncbi:MAG: hypothetical protein AB7Q69_00620 [Gemmatimonadales bacterium]